MKRFPSVDRYFLTLMHDDAINDAIAAHRLFSYLIRDSKGAVMQVLAVNPSILYCTPRNCEA